MPERPALFHFRDLQPLTPPAGFTDEAERIGVAFDPPDLERLGLYLACLYEGNTQANLTAIRDASEAWRRHILDSLTLIGPLSDLAEGSTVLDVGSGGGLPGLPLAICMPDLRFTLLEATAKKCDFLTAAAARAGASNVRIVNARAETAAHDRGDRTATGRTGGMREQFDAVVARAVGRLASLAEITVPFAKVGGRILLIKGQKAEEELEEAATALHALKAVHAGTIDTPTGRIVVLEKNSATPRTFPRRDGEPRRSPISG